MYRYYETTVKGMDIYLDLFSRSLGTKDYETPIAAYDRKSEVMYVSEKKYSRTTSKYTNRFLNEYPWATVERVEEAVLSEYMEEI